MSLGEGRVRALELHRRFTRASEDDDEGDGRTDGYETCPTLDYQRYAEDKVVFSICAGSIVLGASGVADGRRATGNRGIIEQLKQDFPKGAVVRGRPMRC